MRDKDKMFAEMLKCLHLVMQLHENRLCRHFPVHAEFLVGVGVHRSHRDPVASEESLALWPDGASGIKCLKFNTSKVDNFPGSYGDKAVVNATARYREFRYDPQLVAWFMEREQVQAVDKNLTAFKQPKRADNDVPRVSSIGHSTCPNGDIRLTFAVFQALAVE